MTVYAPGFSANLGFLWTELSLPDAIRAAAQNGFTAVECHWPYQEDAGAVQSALTETGLEMLGLNTDRGDVANGENGLTALPGREDDARSAIDQAIDYASRLGTRNVHVMAGNSTGEQAHATFVSNLRYACAKAAENGITIMIEPLNRYDAPDYFLKTSEQALEIIREVSEPNLKLMFDCYHLQIMEGDISRRLEKCLSDIGHIQIASVPDRAEPDRGELNYDHVVKTLNALGYGAPLGAEYKPAGGSTDEGLDWMKLFPRR